MKRIPVLIFLIVLVSDLTHGQINSSLNDTINIDPVVVTATRTDKQILSVPVRIHALTASALASAQIQSIDDALRNVPGVNVNRPFGILSTKATISMRGLSGKEQGRVLVLLDGIPLNKSDGGTVDWNMIDISDVSRIEITKGAGSSIYGGSAMGGIINIITQKPTKKLSIRGSLEYGTYNTMGARFGLSSLIQLKKENSFYWSINSIYRTSDGYITQSEREQKENPYITKSNMEEAGFNIRTGLSLNKKHNLEILIKYYNDRRGTGEKVFQPKGNITDHDSYGITLNYQLQNNLLSIKSSAYFLNEDYKKVNEYKKDDYTWYNVLSSRSDYGWLNSMTIETKNHTFTGGIDIKTGGVDGEDVYFTSTDIVYNEGKVFTAAMFLQDEIDLGKRYKILAGLRYDKATFLDGAFFIANPSMETSFMSDYQVPDMPERNWSALSPRFALQYKINNKNDRIYASVSRGFRPSELEYLCRSGRIKGGFKIASPSLKPEYLTNFESGIDLTIKPELRFSASVYFSKGKDFQYYVSNGQTIDMGFGSRPIFIRDNLGGVNIYGLEADFNYVIAKGLTMNGSYAWAHSEITNYSAVISSDTINLNGRSFTDVPDHIAILGIRSINRIINGSLLIRYTGTMFVNDQNVTDEIIGRDKYAAYTTVDIKFWKDFSEKYRVSLGVQNITDVKFYDSKYSVGPGRTIMLALNFNL